MRGFHRVIFKEDADLRGREKGEVARLLCEAVNDESPDAECHIVFDEVEALRSEVFGEGAVTVVDGGEMNFSNLPYVGDGEGLALFDVKVHVLPAGCGFHLSERRPFSAGAGGEK